MKYLCLVFCSFVGFALTFPLETNEKKPSVDVPVTTTTTEHSPKADIYKVKNIKKETDGSNGPLNEKPSTKKRDAPLVFGEYLEDDFKEPRDNEDYFNRNALRSYRNGARFENFMAEPNPFSESRRKRTAGIEGIFNRPEGFYEPEPELTPEDLMILAAFQQQQQPQKFFSGLPYGRWNDLIDPMELQEQEFGPEYYNDRRDNSYDRFYDQKFNNWANNSPKPAVFNRNRRSFSGYSKLRVPLIRRAVL